MVSKVLVTGGSGFIGSHVIRDLVDTGHEVVNADLRPPVGPAEWLLADASDKITFAEMDVTNWSSLVTTFTEHRPAAVIHIAAIVNPEALDRQPGLAVNVNIGGTYNVLETSRLFDVERFILFSSMGVLAPVQFEPQTVDHPIFLADHGPNVSFYGAAKVASEALAWAYNSAYGLDIGIIRPSAVYGFGQQHPIYVKPMVENSLAGEPTRFPTGRNFPRDYTHAADVATLTRLMVDQPADKVKDRVFFGATGEALVTAGDIADHVRDLIPGADIEVGEGLDAFQEIDLKCRAVLSIDNARAQLGFEPRYLQIREGLEDYINKYRQYAEERP